MLYLSSGINITWLYPMLYFIIYFYQHNPRISISHFVLEKIYTLKKQLVTFGDLTKNISIWLMEKYHHRSFNIIQGAPRGGDLHYSPYMYAIYTYKYSFLLNNNRIFIWMNIQTYICVCLCVHHHKTEKILHLCIILKNFASKFLSFRDSM